MKPKLYLETSVVSYLASKPSRDVVVAGHQAVTNLWWENFRHHCDLYTSQTVIDEIKLGDPNAVQKRLSIIEDIPVLSITEEVDVFAIRLLREGPLPPKARLDAFHIGAAVVHGMTYLLTWNCRHIANAFFYAKIDDLCAKMGYEGVIICTPDELTEIDYDERPNR